MSPSVIHEGPVSNHTPVATLHISSSESSSLPNSQTSSFDESIPSQVSLPRPTSTDNLYHSQGEHPPGRVTPSTSLSNHSSQDRQRSDTESSPYLAPAISNGYLQSRARPLPLDLLHTQTDLMHTHTNGQKRTANGEIKSAGSSLPTSPVEGIKRGHSRHTSINSKGSQIGELSNQLRTRLSYAMVKVQNGWESRSIDELEHLTSQQASPISAVSTTRRSYESTRSNPPNLQPDRTGFAQSSERTTATPEYLQSAQHINGNSRHQNTYLKSNGPVRSPPPNQAGRTYESFWLEHSGSDATKHIPTNELNHPPSLAPAVDIVPRSHRRSNPPQMPSYLQTNNAYTFNDQSSASAASPTSTVVATPPRSIATTVRTPSQKAAMEKDAVETLLFMSSPGNSSYHPPSQLPGTPLRNTFATQKRVGFTSAVGGLDSSDEEHRSTKSLVQQRPALGSTRLKNGDDIDRILDAMPDDDSSSDDEILTSRQRAQPSL